MIDKDKDKILTNINSKDSPEEIFTEGFSDLIVYTVIVEFGKKSNPGKNAKHLNKVEKEDNTGIH